MWLSATARCSHVAVPRVHWHLPMKAELLLSPRAGTATVCITAQPCLALIISIILSIDCPHITEKKKWLFSSKIFPWKISSSNALPKTTAQICSLFSSYKADAPSNTTYFFRLLQPKGAFFFVFFSLLSLHTLPSRVAFCDWLCIPWCLCMLLVTEVVLLPMSFHRKKYSLLSWLQLQYSQFSF